MYGSCSCRNFELDWQLIDLSLVPRACQCDYCRPRSLAYVSKPGSRFTVTVHNSQFHQVVQQGSQSAHFHECSHCATLVCVTADIDGRTYGAVNAACMDNKLGFAEPVSFSVGGLSAMDKQQRWRQLWCCPVELVAGS